MHAYTHTHTHTNTYVHVYLFIYQFFDTIYRNVFFFKVLKFPLYKYYHQWWVM